MITIRRSPTADSRTCDVSQVEKQDLLDASRQHIADVGVALGFFASKLVQAASVHDYDKLSGIDWFFEDFRTGFKQTGWWDNHRRIHRHHLLQEDGIPADVNLLDVLEFIADCVSGDVYPLGLSDDVLRRAFDNTAALMRANVTVLPDDESPPAQTSGEDERKD